MAGMEWRHGAQRRSEEVGTATTPGTRQPRPPPQLSPCQRDPEGERGRRQRQAQAGRWQGGGDNPRIKGASRGGGKSNDTGHSPAQTPVADQAASEGA